MFTVVWSNDARDALTVGWIKADSVVRRELAASSALLDKHLRANAPRHTIGCVSFRLGRSLLSFWFRNRTDL